MKHRYKYKDILNKFVWRHIGPNINYGPIQDTKVLVASILDEFSYNCFKYEAEFIQLGINNWKDIIDGLNPHFLFVESAWEGLDGQWRNKVSNLQYHKDKTLIQVVNYCKLKKIPTVFWAKEDPYDFDLFIEAASYFDYIFTTDSHSISKYHKILKHENVFLLPFAAQPQLHNPINKDRDKIGKVVFPGGWYSKFPQRSLDMENIVFPSFQYGLTIYDRFHNGSKKNQFPTKYRPYIEKGLDYLDMIEKYKKYEILLNVNSTHVSPTTFSRRVFEVLASGIPIISSYSLGIENFFGDIVKMSTSKTETHEYLKLLLGDNDLRAKLSLLGQREIFSNHTYKIRFNEILNRLGLINYLDLDLDQGVSIITCSNRVDSLKNILNNYDSQTYPIKELIIVINSDKISYNDWHNIVKDRQDIKIYKLNENSTLGECLNFAVSKSNYPYISKFDDDDYYGPNYLLDIINTFSYSGAHIVGKYTVFAYMEKSNSLILRYPDTENQYIGYVAGSTLTFKKSIFEKVRFRSLNKSEDTLFLNDAISLGYKIYSADRFNHVIHRRDNLDTHTWKISEREFMKKSILIKVTTDYKSIVNV